MQNPATAAPPPPVKYKCARCSIPVTDIDEWNHHLETCLTRSHDRVHDSQNVVNSDDNESLHSHTSIYIDTESIKVRLCKCGVCPNIVYSHHHKKLSIKTLQGNPHKSLLILVAHRRNHRRPQDANCQVCVFVHSRPAPHRLFSSCS
jgi:hypothetical protein